jgi:peptide/nickel transport system permease protein
VILTERNEHLLQDVSRQGRRFISILESLFHRLPSAVGMIVLLSFLLLALFGPWIAPFGANEQIYEDARQPPSSKHWFGTDYLGRDIYSRVVIGARDVLALAGLGTSIAVLFGTTLGLITGYIGGWIDEVIMRFFDSIMALPALLLALVLLGALGPSRNSVLIVIGVVYTPIVTRVIRSAALSIKTKSFVEAARIQGEPLAFLLFREILPSALPTLAVEASLRFSYAIFLVASLGFLGVGVQPPSPDWGLMVKEGRANVTQTPWALYFPAGAIALVVISVNMVADALKDIMQTPTRLRR